MIPTKYSFLLSMLLSILFAIAVHLLWTRSFLLKRFGASTISALYFVCALRMTYPFEVPTTIPLVLSDKASAVFRMAGFATDGALLRVPELFMVVWFFGSAASLFYFILKNLTADRKIKRYNVCADGKVARIFMRVQAEAVRHPEVDIYTCPINIPMGTGIVHKRILLPELDCTDEQIYYILKHEYAHFCNHDLAVKFLIRIFCCIFWWNPVVYILKRDVAELMEIKADALAVSSFSGQKKRAYIDCVAWVFAQSAKDYSPSVSTPLFIRRKKRPEDEILGRAKLILWPVEKPTKFRQGMALIVAFSIFLASYSFVIQPSFDPPVEEIVTSEHTWEIDTTDAYILKHKDGTYSYVLKDGSMQPMSEKTVQIFVETEETPIIKEE